MTLLSPRVRRIPLNAAAVVTVAVCLFPVYWMVSTAFKPSKDIRSAEPRLVPYTWTLDHFRRAVQADGFELFWRNSVLVTLGAVLLSLVVALGASFAVARLRWKAGGSSCCWSSSPRWRPGSP